MGDALYFKSDDMFAQIQSDASDSARRCQLVGPEISNTIDAGVAIYDGCSSGAG